MKRNAVRMEQKWILHILKCQLKFGKQVRGFNNFGDKRLFEVEQTAVILLV